MPPQDGLFREGEEEVIHRCEIERRRDPKGQARVLLHSSLVGIILTYLTADSACDRGKRPPFPQRYVKRRGTAKSRGNEKSGLRNLS